MNGWMVGWVGGWTDGRMDGWMDGQSAEKEWMPNEEDVNTSFTSVLLQDSIRGYHFDRPICHHARIHRP